MKPESKILEYKQAMTNSYLKTVSAYANYGDGEIVFGIKDNGEISPIDNMNNFALSIENQINDSFSIRPQFEIILNQNQTITLKVFKGVSTPYFYKGKAYKRSNTATVEVDDLELKRLILQSENKSFDELEAPISTLSFTSLEKRIKEKTGISNFNDDVMITLGLLNFNKYNNAACLLADSNNFSGVDVAVFGDSADIIKERLTFSNISIIDQFYNVLEVFERNYCFEVIDGAERRKIELIPEVAFREILANAIVHRTYDVKINTKISMYPHKIEIRSPGGLMSGLSEEKLSVGTFSVLRNPVIANVFRRIKLIEAFATGIQRANREYSKYDKSISYKADEISVFVCLPVINKKQSDTKYDKYLKLLSKNIKYSRAELQNIFELSKDSLIRLLNKMIDEEILDKEGEGKNTKYYLR